MKGTLVDRAVTEVTETTALLRPLYLSTKGKPSSEWSLASDNTMATPVVFIRERSSALIRPLPFEQPVFLPKSSAMHSFMPIPTDERVAVVTIGSDDVVVITKEGD